MFVGLFWSRQVTCCLTASTERNLPPEIKHLQGNKKKLINNLLIAIKTNEFGRIVLIKTKRVWDRNVSGAGSVLPCSLCADVGSVPVLGDLDTPWGLFFPVFPHDES